MLMEACFKHLEAMLVATNYTGGLANELFAILKERFDRVDNQVTQSFVQQFHNIILLPKKKNSVVRRVQATVKQIGEQIMKEKATDNVVIALKILIYMTLIWMKCTRKLRRLRPRKRKLIIHLKVWQKFCPEQSVYITPEEFKIRDLLRLLKLIQT